MKIRPLSFLFAALAVIVMMVMFPVLAQAADSAAKPVLVKATTSTTPLATAATNASATDAMFISERADWQRRWDFTEKKVKRSKLLMLGGLGAAVLGASRMDASADSNKLSGLMILGGSGAITWGAVDFFVGGAKRDEIRDEGFRRGYLRMGADGISIIPVLGAKAQFAISF